MFLRVVESLTTQLDTADNTSQAKILDLLLNVLQNPLLEAAMHGLVDELMAIALRVHGMFPDGPLEDPSGWILSQIKVAQKVDPK